ncbi:IS66 family insertion sequence element accessory protein TnpB [Halorhodospira halochloris]|uniref:IS66 family insertion sequence element accessory protein TnpB n=1 Tax=Halorhodospira halochloris TaxID=1052 RepID=UPI001EE9396E|nr:IS66 family insertion sequence element accessory protein TnpB [Halorhodospira halochloris]MCG5531717.1 IS66 family insertion sequence element accessory protein TnpB [Halorhodospira halochloris]
MLSRERKLWLCTEPTDMRKSYDSLASIVRYQLGADPLSGHGFIFINRRRNQLKMLYFDVDGYCVWCKRLERGRFSFVQDSNGKAKPISAAQFAALLEGIELEITKRQKRWQRPLNNESNMAEYT